MTGVLRSITYYCIQKKKKKFQFKDNYVNLFQLFQFLEFLQQIQHIFIFAEKNASCTVYSNDLTFFFCVCYGHKHGNYEGCSNMNATGLIF